jgi:peptidoglycan/xylan/chitin deacetylase (PgdA/CDA1 family)
LIGLSICAAAFCYYGVPYFCGRLLRISLKRDAIKQNALVLTFDDGPGSKLTPAILDILEKHDAKATFFLLGKNIEGREVIVQQILSKGHEIGSHGYEHMNYWKVLPFRSLADIKKGWQAINAALGTEQDVYPLRSPYGRLNIVCLLYLWLKKVPIINWTIDSGDTWRHEQRDSQRASVLTRNLGGGIVLAHDNDRLNPDTELMVLESVRSVLAVAEEAGMRVLTVSQLLCNYK